MTSVIVDVQGFKLHENNEFICKEFAVIDIKSGVCSSHMFKPPFAWSKLNRQSRKCVQWLTAHHHNLEWCAGQVEYSKVENIIKKLESAEIDRVYVKGGEKVRWLEKYIQKRIINLESLDCPALSELYTPLDKNYCNMHINNCAVRNVNTLRNWFNYKFNTFNAIKAFYESGILNFMSEEEIACLPMEFVMVYAANQISQQWSKFPEVWRLNQFFLQYQCCDKHHTEEVDGDLAGGWLPLKKDCKMCNNNAIM